MTLAKLLMVCSLLLAASTMASDLAPATWKRGAIDVYVSAFDWEQFPNRVDADGRLLVFVVSKSKWQSYTADQKALIMRGIKKLRGGTVKLNRSNIVAWGGQLTSAGVDCGLVLPNDNPTLTDKLYLFVIKQDTVGRLGEFGLVQPEPIPPPS